MGLGEPRLDRRHRAVRGGRDVALVDHVGLQPAVRLADRRRLGEVRRIEVGRGSLVALVLVLGGSVGAAGAGSGARAGRGAGAGRGA
ncbi:hypothetical protein ET996_09555 [Propioniciclava tarda]|uniref:Uncharacterized protein n=1 Tax=Propioniciclava tarda TaxID=433330 RepID=A0A4Q9KKD3_PROTD|nr:hypothetical protein ET996_09555 [Propioniciclava tarda]